MALGKEKLNTAQKALKTIEELLVRQEKSDIIRDAAIQRFEYTFEAVWKAGRIFLREQEGIEVASPKATIRAFFQAGYLTEKQAQTAFAMVDDRNLTSHTYNEQLAEQIFSQIPSYARLMKAWLKSMKKLPLTR